MALAKSGTVSERHAAARNDESKITAGQLATAMRRAGMKVTARELAPLATEWHHAGWNPSGGMGRCFFFRSDDLSAERMANLYHRVEAARREAAAERFGWAVEFRKDGRRWQPIAAVRRFAPGVKMPKKFEAITAEEFAAMEPFAGEDLESYESRAAFLARMTAPEPVATPAPEPEPASAAVQPVEPGRQPRPLTDEERQALAAADLEALRPLKRRQRKDWLFTTNLPNRAEALDEVARLLEAGVA